MKHTLFILALLTATIQTFAQSPRIKLNQITKDSLTGSVLISSPTDSGMVYSRDLFISYGADTVLILGGDTLAATSGIISSVLSDGVTITGDGTIGSELTADTSVLATLRALSDSLVNYVSTTELSDSTTNIRTDLDLKQDQLNGTGFVKATGTTITYDNSTYLTSEVDGSVTNEIQDISTTGAAGNISISSGSTLNLNVDDADASATNELQTLSYNSSTNEITLSDGGGTEDLSNLDLVDSTRINATGDTAYYYQNGVLIGTGAIAGGGGGGSYNNISETADTVYISDYLDVDTSTLYVDAVNNRVGIGTSSPQATFDMQNGSGALFEVEYTLANGKGVQFIDSDDNTSSLSVSSGSGTDGIFLPYITMKRGAGQSGLGTGVGGYFAVDVDNSIDVLLSGGAGYVITVTEDGAYNNPVENMNTFMVRNGITSQFVIAANGNATLQGTLTENSDIRLKTNINQIKYGLNDILQLNPVEYRFIDYPKENRLGFIAQEVEPIIPEAVRGIESKDTYLSIAYSYFTPILTKAIQEQQAIIETQATEIEQLKTLITELSNRLQILENN